MRPKDKTSCEVFAEDRDRINVLARVLTEDGPGQFFQAETIRYLIDFRESMLRPLTVPGELAGELAADIEAGES